MFVTASDCSCWFHDKCIGSSEEGRQAREVIQDEHTIKKKKDVQVLAGEKMKGENERQAAEQEEGQDDENQDQEQEEAESKKTKKKKMLLSMTVRLLRQQHKRMKKEDLTSLSLFSPGSSKEIEVMRRRSLVFLVSFRRKRSRRRNCI